MHDQLPKDLPVAGVLQDVVVASRNGAVVVTAPPGSGKTMLVPAAILDDLASIQKVVLIQPRRMAARAVARWIAQRRDSRVGDEVGYQVRFDSQMSRDTRLLVVTTGILLRRLLDDIALEEVGAVVIDEPVAKLLGGCPIIRAEGRPFPVQVRYQRRVEKLSLPETVAGLAPRALRATSGHVLVFLPGVGEIMRCQEALGRLAEREGHALLPLFGDLPAEQQDRVLADLGRRKIILATNVAETSLTIDGVTAVIDSGQARQMRVSVATGLPRLELLPISQASAEQRAGRAGRTAPGVCWRMWSESSHKARPAAEMPEVLRNDLAESQLQLLTLGERDEFPWLDPPPQDAVDNAHRLLRLLGAIDGQDEITTLGKEMARLPAHPRLGRLLLAGAQRGVLREASIAAALVSERDPFRSAEHVHRGPREYGSVRSRSDVVDRVVTLQAFHGGVCSPDTSLELQEGAARNVLRAAEQLYHLADFPCAPRAENPDIALMQALLEAFPDRLAKLRAGTQDRALLVGGRGVRIDSSSRVRGEPLFLAIDLNDAGGEARARLVSAVERSWLSPEILNTREELFFNPARRQVEARVRSYWVDLMLGETPVAISDLNTAAELLAQHARHELDRLLPKADTAAGKFLARVRWLAEALLDLQLPALDEIDLQEMLPEICQGLRSFDELRAADWLSYFQSKVGYERLPEIDRLAPAQLDLPSGNRHEISYELGKTPVLAVRIQELFGVRETPRLD